MQSELSCSFLINITTEVIYGSFNDFLSVRSNFNIHDVSATPENISMRFILLRARSHSLGISRCHN